MLNGYQQDAEGLRTIRVFPDYGHLWPLWESGTDKYAMEPEDYRISADLTSALRSWYDDWERNCPHDGTWPTIEHGRQWHQTGKDLARQLHREVRDFADVSYEAGNYID